LDKLAHDRAQAVEFLSKPQNKTIADQSEFLNNAFQRRSFSWTRIFMDLEKIMPPRIHVVSITPELTRDNQIQVHLLVAGDSRDRAIELIRRMEDSSTFKRAELHSETAAQNNQNPADAIQFDISSLYIPEGGQLPPPPPRPGQKAARTGGGM
jgi:Tfp pilus assembly protein PilN